MPKDDITWAVACIGEMLPTYQTCQAYYDGDHPLNFATEKFRNTFGLLFQEFADNLCPGVVEAVSDRLFITGWSGDNGKDAQVLWDKWKLPRIAHEIHRTSPLKGDAYLIVAQNDDGEVKFWPNEPDLICVDYDEENDPSVVVRAAKVWHDDDDYWRCTLWYQDTIERYRTIQPTTNGCPDKPYRWNAIGITDNIYGVVPVFHFGNGADVGCLGVSELKGVTPIQDALNKSVCDMLVAMEFNAYRQRWATGLEVEVDEETGKPKAKPFEPGVDRIWTAAGDVKFGEFSASDIAGFVAAQESFRLEMARVSGVPPHLLALDIEKLPGGEALKVLEGRFAKHLATVQTGFTDVWCAALTLAAEMSSQKLGTDFEPVWGAGSPNNPLLDAETQLVKQQVGVSKRQSLRELGYTEDDIDQMEAETQHEADVKAANALKQAQATGIVGPDGNPVEQKPTPFNRNGPPGQPSKPAPQKQQDKKGQSTKAIRVAS